MGCYREGAKDNPYSITLKSAEHLFSEEVSRKTLFQRKFQASLQDRKPKMRNLKTGTVLMWLGHQVFSTWSYKPQQPHCC